MLKRLLSPFILATLLLAGCQAPQGKFTPEQIAAMQSYGFTESAGDWSLGLSDTILFDKNDYKLRAESQQQIQSMAARLASVGLNHARMDGHTDNYGEDSYNEGKNTPSPATSRRKVALKTAVSPWSSARLSPQSAGCTIPARDA